MKSTKAQYEGLNRRDVVRGGVATGLALLLGWLAFRRRELARVIV